MLLARAIFACQNLLEVAGDLGHVLLLNLTSKCHDRPSPCFFNGSHTGLPIALHDTNNVYQPPLVHALPGPRHSVEPYRST